MVESCYGNTLLHFGLKLELKTLDPYNSERHLQHAT